MGDEEGHAELPRPRRTAGQIGHDLNNVLTAILGHAELLADDLGDDPAQRGVLEIQRAATRATELAEELLALDRDDRAARPPPPATAPLRAARTDALPTPAASTGAGATVLLAEDDDIIRAFAAKVLAAEGFRVLTAADGGEALQAAERHDGPIDVLVTDVVLPGAGGPEIATRLQASCPELRTMFMSGYTDDGALHQALLPADAHFLPKPFGPGELVRRVREILELPRPGGDGDRSRAY